MNRREVKSAPVLRFKGFTNDWEQRKFENLVSRLSKTSNNESLPNVTYDDIKSKENSLNKDITELTHGKKGIHFNKDDILFGKLRPYLGNILLARFNGIAVGDFWVLSPKDNNISSFLFDLIHTSKYKYISNLSSGSKMPRSDWNLVSKASFWVPIQQEQNKIGKIFQLIDNLVSLQQRKNILLYKLRKSLLSTLLTDKCTPKVRFKSFLEPLKKQKLGDMAPLRGGFAFKANNYVNTGIPIIRISNILSNGSIGGNFAYYSEQSDDSNYILFNGSALIAMSGATTGKTAILDLEKKKKVYQNQRVGYFTPTKNSDYSFIKAIIKSNYFLKQLNSIMVAGAQPNVSAVDIDNFTFYFPESKKEQKYIGNNFEIINKIILLQKNRVDKLKKLKRSLLQQLFI